MSLKIRFFSLPTLVSLMMMISLISSGRAATSSLENNPGTAVNITSTCVGSMHECLIIADEDDEWIDGSLLTLPPVTIKFHIPNKPIIDCGRGVPNLSCFPGKNVQKPPENCPNPVYKDNFNYNRACP